MTALKEDAALLQSLIDQSDRIVFFGGAGVSTESGIPDFRSKDGLFNREEKVRPEVILSSDYFYLHPKDFYRYYSENILLLDKKPNAAHRYLAELEKSGKLKGVITQNIDGLHQRAGSENVIELHGSIHRNKCIRCGREYSAEELKALGAMRCESCNALIKPDVVLYGEQLNSASCENAIEEISRADLLIVAGTSLKVYPAAYFLRYFQGKHMVLINADQDASYELADVVLHQKVGELFSLLHA